METETKRKLCNNRYSRFQGKNSTRNKGHFISIRSTYQKAVNLYAFNNNLKSCRGTELQGKNRQIYSRYRKLNTPHCKEHALTDREYFF